ncbi:MAG: hypothetical protein LBR44_12275 [Clostridiales Family XIII bacterium]|jgi:hypothetical protein|nr:hypothetical protein [Clostridiales Family XIII bacterium]
MYRVVSVGADARHIDDFVGLPRRFYTPRFCTHRASDERALLAGAHPLSGDFSLEAFLAYGGEGGPRAPAGRCALAVYPGDETAYLGFFECAEDPLCAKLLLDAAAARAAELRRSLLMGPVDASYWLGCRMKTDAFDRPPFFGEPYNRPYYPALWEANGFAPAATYVSRIFDGGGLARRMAADARFARNEGRFLDAGYRVESVTPATFERSLLEIHGMVAELYAGFPGFRPIDPGPFRAMFSRLRPLLDLSLVKIAYLDGAPVGFAVTVPDHGCLPERPGLPDLLKIQLRRTRAASYVVLYVGARKGHEGLVPVMLAPVWREIRGRRAGVAGALIREGKATANYFGGTAAETRHYALYVRSEL